MKNLFVLFFMVITLCSKKVQRNIVLIIADDLGSDWCGFQEYRVDTVKMLIVRKLLSRGVSVVACWAKGFNV